MKFNVGKAITKALQKQKWRDELRLKHLVKMDNLRFWSKDKKK